MYARSIQPDQSSVNSAALVTELLQALVESSTAGDQAASKLGEVLRSNEMSSEQALTVERVFKALRAHFEGLAQVHESLAPYLPPEQAAQLHAAVVELRGRLGLAAGALRRWNLGAQSCTETARQASTTMTSVRTTLTNAIHAAEQILVF